MSTSKKNCHYKIDFHAEIDGRKFALSDFNRRNRNDIRGVAAVVAEFYKEGDKRKQLLAAIDISKVPTNRDFRRYYQKFTEVESDADFWKWMAEIRSQDGNNNNWWNFAGYLCEILTPAIKAMPEYVKVENDFQKWLKMRPGIVEAWAKFDNYRRVNVKKYNFRSDEEMRNYQRPLELNIDNFIENRTDARFRGFLENDRPLKFKTGQIVKLKDEYKSKKGKDPFRYNADLRNAVRLGVVAEQQFDGQYGNYGVGSRVINVMWFATGEESGVMERCLKLVKDEEMDNATTSI